MQQSPYHRKFCDAREIITDTELRRLTEKYHNRHPTFSIDIQERTCKTIILDCIYHYRHVEIDIRCRCIYDDILRRFQPHWSSDNVEYKQNLEDIFLRVNSTSINRSLDDQIESIIEHITKYFTQLKPIFEYEQQIELQTRDNSSSPIEIIKYERSPQSRRRQLLERSFSWSQPLIVRPIYSKLNSLLIERKMISLKK